MGASRSPSLLDVKDAKTVTVQGISVQDMAAGHPLRWQACMPSASCDSENYEYHWRLLQFLFQELEDPRVFPPLALLPAKGDLDILNRYCDHAVDLGEASILNSRELGATIRFGPQGSNPVVKTRFGTRDALIGFSVLFRQCFSREEAASFISVQRVLRDATRVDGGLHLESRMAALRMWGRAQGKLRGYTLTELSCGALAGREPTHMDGEQSVELVISTFNYGSDIHWGKRRELLAAWQRYEVIEAAQRLVFLESTAALSFLYIGFAQLVAAALGRAFGAKEEEQR